MRIFDETGKEQFIRELGPVPGIDHVIETVKAEFDLLDPTTLSEERVFQKSHRLVADSELFQGPQRHSVAPRKQALTALCEPIAEWLKHFYPNCRPVLMQITTLPPSVKLLWHIDCYLYQSASHKVHVPIFTNPDAFYMAQDATNNDEAHSFHFEVGKAYEINNIKMHTAVNRGSSPRSHIIIDMMREDELARWEAEGINFFFTHHREHKKMEMAATYRAGKRSGAI